MPLNKETEQNFLYIVNCYHKAETLELNRVKSE